MRRKLHPVQRHLNAILFPDDVYKRGRSFRRKQLIFAITKRRDMPVIWLAIGLMALIGLALNADKL